MAEEINAQCLQEQIDKAKQDIALHVQLDKIKRVIDRGLLYTFIVGVIGSLGNWILLCLNTLGLLPDNPIIAPFGILVFVICVSFCMLYVQNAKTEYKKLLEQLQQTYNITK
jgi:hypothetical protein